MTLDKIFKNWGEKKQILPKDNIAIKNSILSKVSEPSNFYQPVRSYPWLSLTFATLAVLFCIGSSVISRPEIYMTGVSGGVSSVARETTSTPSFEYNNKQMSPPYYGYGGNLDLTDNREFLKTYYNASIRTRNVSSLVSKVNMVVRSFSGRV